MNHYLEQNGTIERILFMVPFIQEEWTGWDLNPEHKQKTGGSQQAACWL